MEPTIIEACDQLDIPYPVSAQDLHETYFVFLTEGIEPNTKDTKCWRGTCDCIEAYAGRPLAIQRIMEHLELLNSRNGG